MRVREFVWDSKKYMLLGETPRTALHQAQYLTLMKREFPAIAPVQSVDLYGATADRGKYTEAQITLYLHVSNLCLVLARCYSAENPLFAADARIPLTSEQVLAAWEDYQDTDEDGLWMRLFDAILGIGVPLSGADQQPVETLTAAEASDPK